MTPEVRKELERTLRWVQDVRDQMDEQPQRRAELQTAGFAYIGGVLTTLGELRLISLDEHDEWWDRLIELIGELPADFPPGPAGG